MCVLYVCGKRMEERENRLAQKWCKWILWLWCETARIVTHYTYCSIYTDSVRCVCVCMLYHHVDHRVTASIVSIARIYRFKIVAVAQIGLNCHTFLSLLFRTCSLEIEIMSQCVEKPQKWPKEIYNWEQYHRRNVCVSARVNWLNASRGNILRWGFLSRRATNFHPKNRNSVNSAPL